MDAQKKTKVGLKKGQRLHIFSVTERKNNIIQIKVEDNRIPKQILHYDPKGR
jgi:hypothetical protein